jgi:hypothetical protein
MTIDSLPPHGSSPAGHGTFVPVQTTYKPSVGLMDFDLVESLWRGLWGFGGLGLFGLRGRDFKSRLLSGLAVEEGGFGDV